MTHRKYWSVVRWLPALALGAVGLLFSSQPVAQAAGVGAAQNITVDEAGSLQAKSAQDPQGNLHVVWVSQEKEGNRVRYSKGTWNGASYTFGAGVVIDDVGSFGYATPNIAVAPNGTVMAAWSNNFQLRIRSWQMGALPGNGTVMLGTGKDPALQADADGRFHIVWNGDFNVQYCEWNGAACSMRETFSPDASNYPDVAVDSNGGVHLVFVKGNSPVLYRARPKGGPFGPIQTIGEGNGAQIAADAKGAVHIVYSRDFNIQYCTKTLTSGCSGQATFDVDGDITPSVGATPSGGVVVAWRGDGQRAYVATRESGAWSTPRPIGSGEQIDVLARSYVERSSITWSQDWEIQHLMVDFGPPPPPRKYEGPIVFVPLAVR